MLRHLSDEQLIIVMLLTENQK